MPEDLGRRLPIYLLLGTSASMYGEPIAAIQQGVKALISDLKNDPQAVETAYLSIITFNNTAQQVVPLTELMDFQEPDLVAEGQRSLGAGLTTVREAIEREVRVGTATSKGDWHPLIFLLTDGEPTDNWEEPLQNLKDLGIGKIIALGAGPDASTAVLNKITDAVLQVNSMTPGDMAKYFKWCSIMPSEIDKKKWSNIYNSNKGEILMSEELTRRLPVYLLLDTSGSMYGEPIAAVQQGLKALISDLKNDPQAVETAYLSVITFNSSAQQVVPLTELMDFQEPDLEADGLTSLGEALTLVQSCVEREVKKGSATQKGDWKPLIFLMTDGEPTDSWERAANELKSKKLGNIIALAAGPGASTAVLKKITEAVLQMNSMTPGDMAKFFKWVSSSIKLASSSVKQVSSSADQQMTLPPPPANSGFTIVM